MKGILIFPEKATYLRLVTYRGSQQAGKIIALPLYELERRIKEQL